MTTMPLPAQWRIECWVWRPHGEHVYRSLGQSSPAGSRDRAPGQGLKAFLHLHNLRSRACPVFCIRKNFVRRLKDPLDPPVYPPQVRGGIMFSGCPSGCPPVCPLTVFMIRYFLFTAVGISIKDCYNPINVTLCYATDWAFSSYEWGAALNRFSRSEVKVQGQPHQIWQRSKIHFYTISSP